ncbi:hypothetical protein CEXT_424511 [Caerostris extrusa]|uniref:Uncharacterized protein n=1 Tax=Caerostris extrusa TaxID=172846 RepID=A0AAV4XKY0_CAEEX|nr:hypothetical protein CEXT_424511 [Caerostris extrusa]
MPPPPQNSKEDTMIIIMMVHSQHRFHESAVLCLFVLLVLLWTFREPKFMSGWADLISTETRIGDAVPAVAILFLLFLFPAEPWRIRDSPALLKWSAVQSKVPWGLIILLGGGFALAKKEPRYCEAGHIRCF